MRFPSTLRPSGKKCLGNRKFPSRLQSAMRIEVMCNFTRVTRNSFDIHDFHIFSLDSSQPMFVAVSVVAIHGAALCQVESFARKAPITETNLDRLERRIQSRAQGKAG